MRILIVMSNPAIGGTETFILSITPYFEKMGCDVKILNIWKNSLMKKPTIEAKLTYEELNSNSRRIGFNELVGVFKVMRCDRYDIVLGFGLRVSILLRLLKLFFRGTPFIIGLREIAIWRKWYHVWLDRLTRRGCDLFIPNSEAVAKMFIAREKLSCDKMVVIRNGISLQEFDKSRFHNINRQSLGLPAEKVIITTVANLRYEKGHDFYVEVIGAFLEELDNVHFVWIGEGPLKSKLENGIRSIGASDKITFMGLVEDVRPVLSCSDIFVLPSREEGMPRALMEAMAMSVPCVATNVGGVDEVIENEVSGLIVDFGDVENFGQHIVRLANNKKMRNKIGTAARRRIEEEFDMRRIAKKYVKLFELVASGQQSGRQLQQQIDD